MPSINHTHKYERIIQGKNKSHIIFACRLPNCTHFLTRELIVGKESLCWKCHDSFVLGSMDRNMRRPVCSKHKDRRKKLEVMAPSIDVDALLMELGVSSRK